MVEEMRMGFSSGTEEQGCTVMGLDEQGDLVLGQMRRGLQWGDKGAAVAQRDWHCADKPFTSAARGSDPGLRYM